MDRQQEFVLRTIEERDIRFVRLWFTDVLGSLKSVAVAPAELEGAFAEGIGFDGSAIEGLARVYEADMLVRPDPARSRCCRGAATTRHRPDVLRHPHARRRTRAQPTPGTSSSAPSAGPPSTGSPSTRTPRSSSTCSRTSRSPAASPSRSTGRLLRPRPARHRARLPAGRDRRCSRAWASSVEFSHHEGGPGQNEIDLRYADALSTADNIMTFRTVIKEVAIEQGVYATFMPKPFAGQPGSGMHTHMSLFEGDRNAFHEAGAEYQLSQGRPGSSSPASCGTPPRSPPSRTSGSTRTSGCGAAARRRATSAGATTTARPSSGCPCTSRARATRPGSSTGHWTRRATPTSRSRSCWPPGSRASTRATTCPTAPRTTCGRSPTPSGARSASSPCRPAWPRRSASWRSPSSSPRPSARACSTSSCATSARSGGLPPAGHAVRAQPLPPAAVRAR